MISFAVFVGIFYIIRQSYRKKDNAKSYLWLWIFVFPVLVGISRVMLGVHTYLDVFGGAITGILITILFIEIISRIDFLRNMWLSKKNKP